MAESNDSRLRRWLRSQRLTIAKRELRVLGREKTIVLALVIQLFIAGFSGFLVVGLVSLYDPASVEGLQIEAAVTGGASDEMADAIDEQDSMSATTFEDSTEAFEAFDDGQVQAVFETMIREDRIEVVLTAPEGSLETTLVVAEGQQALRALERTQRLERSAQLSVQPLELPAESGGNPYFDFTYTVLIPLLVFLPVFISGSITVDSITEEIDRGTLELLRVAPISLTEIVDGKALAMIAIAPIQAALWLALLAYNGVAISNPGWLVALASASAVIVVGLAVMVSLLTVDRQPAQLLFAVGVLLLFGAASLLPGSPANTAALLAIGSASLSTYLAVVGMLGIAAVVAVCMRVLTTRVDPSAL